MSDPAPADAPVRSFNIRKKNRGTPRPTIPFEIDGQTYHLHTEVNGLVVMDLATLATLRIGQDSQPMWEFFEGCLGNEYPSFRRHIRSPDIDIEAEDFRELVMWMVEQVTENPTVRSSS